MFYIGSGILIFLNFWCLVLLVGAYWLFELGVVYQHPLMVATSLSMLFRAVAGLVFVGFLLVRMVNILVVLGVGLVYPARVMVSCRVPVFARVLVLAQFVGCVL